MDHAPLTLAHEIQIFLWFMVPIVVAIRASVLAQPHIDRNIYEAVANERMRRDSRYKLVTGEKPKRK